MKNEMIKVEMTSLEIATLTGKAPKHVNETIRNKLLPQLNTHGQDFDHEIFSVKTSTYINSRGRKYDMYVLNKNAANALVAYYDLSFAMKVITHMDTLEKENQKLIEENRMLNDLIAQTFKEKAWVGQEFGAKAAGIQHPRKMCEFIKRNPKAVENFARNNYFIERQVGKSSGDRAWMWSQEGFEYLITNKDKLNERTKYLMEQDKLNIIF